MKPINSNLYLIVFLVSSLAFLSCAGISPYYEDEAKKDVRIKAERNFDPLNFEGDTLVVPPPLETERTDNGSPLDRFNLVEDVAPEDSAETSIHVYRVQIFASRLLQEAEQVEAEVSGLFDEPVHLDYDEPYYKVRIGDFRTLEEGEEYLGKVRDLGYDSAWVVRVELQESP
ncbi:MAG: hypothetical protein GF315_10815 [candidate division Zixibacteria bacterium]|nr:hypothetical protein [candidate division Zixibacteria bacterium]